MVQIRFVIHDSRYENENTSFNSFYGLIILIIIMYILYISLLCGSH